MADRASFPDDDFDAIKPRPVFAEEIQPRPVKSITSAVIAAPAPEKPRPDRAREIAQAAVIAQENTHAPVIRADVHSANDGATQSDILLRAIVLVARREPQTPATRAAMRDLIRRHSVECGLGF